MTWIKYILYALALVALVLLFVSMVQNEKDIIYVNDKSHYTDTGFDNPYVKRPKEFKEFWKWVRSRDGEARRTAVDLVDDVPVNTVDHQVIRTPIQGAQATWLGHATILVQINGVNIITDPMFSKRSSPVSFAGPERVIPPALQIPELPEIHYALISHNHYDHLDRRSVKELGNSIMWLVPLGLAEWFTDLGIRNVQEFDWWDELKVGDLRITCTPTQHFSGRTPWDTDRTLWGSWAIQKDSTRFWFGGDTGYNELQFKEIGERLGPFNLAAIPIGAYKPEWFMGPVHTGPAEALQIHKDIGAQQSFGIHWGTFLLADDLLTEAMAETQRLSAADPQGWQGFEIWPIGSTRSIRPFPKRAEPEKKSVTVSQ